MTKLRIATRSSNLALWQADHVAESLCRKCGVEAELVHVSTTGDRDQRDSIAAFGGIGVFTREVQRAVLDGRADVAVHSLKDLPTEPAEGLCLAAVPARAPRFDALVLPGGISLPEDPAIALAALPDGARLGTGSPRRRSQLLRLRPDLSIEDVRGNVDTRLRKLDDGAYDALVLAEAGLTRLGFHDRISARLTPPAMYPAVGQGALGIECRFDDTATRDFLALLDDRIARAEVMAERSALSGLRAGCHAPVGAYARLEGDRLRLDVVLLSLDGRTRLLAEGIGEDAESLGREVAEKLIAAGGAELL